ncbi:RWD domain-containing protein 2B isoform X1 [Triplophysa rosa]|uniref:RWD domain-containing protein 2B n=2 Tax=Triplophysa rosa TaxID=992332 RepID=A0A9W7X3X6_TRIRA|nr:RWD domain-containing protein 2B isoform X1 [Triplophysa rosa]KAI7813563.1 RWD domain-containing protein 2B [Triplophysa rosa]
MVLTVWCGVWEKKARSMACSDDTKAQLAEIELLLSMFPSEEELQVDQLSHAELGAFVEGSADTPPSTRPQFSVMLKVENPEVNITLSCTYPIDYPRVLPEITVRCPELSRAQQTQLHSDLSAYLSENCCGDVCVLSAVQWIKDNAQKYVTRSIPLSESKKESVLTQSKESFTRLWIYSHHIYNKIKRKNILEWSKELNLSGFSMPGKPGIVCVEGLQSACEEFWARVKVLTWKRIMIRHREDFPLDNTWTEDRIDSFRKFTSFNEAIFDPHGNRGNHMDLGQLFQFLNDKGCADIFQMYFGIEGR